MPGFVFIDDGTPEESRAQKDPATRPTDRIKTAAKIAQGLGFQRENRYGDWRVDLGI